MTTKEKFSFNLNWMLEATEMSQSELARRVGVSQQTANCWIKGTKLPSIETLIKICEVLDVRSDFLLGFSFNNYPKIEIHDIEHHEFQIVDHHGMQLTAKY